MVLAHASMRIANKNGFALSLTYFCSQTQIFIKAYEKSTLQHFPSQHFCQQHFLSNICIGNILKNICNICCSYSRSWDICALCCCSIAQLFVLLANFGLLRRCRVPSAKCLWLFRGYRVTISEMRSSTHGQFATVIHLVKTFFAV